MPLKPFNELVKLDVTSHCKTRDGATYLPWGKCKMLLHDNGAEKVSFTPIVGPNGHTVRMTDEVYTDAKGNTQRCYEIWVEVRIDDDVYTMYYPVINGIHAIHNKTMSQRAVNTAIARAFVKCVAINTGLGFSLWLDDYESDMSKQETIYHSAIAVKRRLEEKITSKVAKGVDLKDILHSMNTNETVLKKAMGACDWLVAFEQVLDKF